MGAVADVRQTSGSCSVPCFTSVLMIYYLCCWPGDNKSDTSSEKHQSRRSTVRHESGSRRSSHLFGNRVGSSAVSLHLPSTSGTISLGHAYRGLQEEQLLTTHRTVAPVGDATSWTGPKLRRNKEPLSAHRSHEEIGRRKSHLELTTEESTRYHSAPSVIDEVIHRRDWDRSTKELYIPLKPETVDIASISSDSLERAARAEPESYSSDEHKTEEQIVGRTCKKHYTNIKSSKGRKEKQVEEDKDCDATEESTFFIGDNDASASNSPKREDLLSKSIYKAKEAKQCLNESIRCKERPRQTLVPLVEHQPRMFGFCLDDVIDQLESLDRSGATHHSIESRISLSKPAFPPPSVEPAGYEWSLSEAPSGTHARVSAGASGMHARVSAGASGMRARHASDGDILAPSHRPESGAFSESDLDLELVGAEERPPPYDELALFASPERKETAI